MSKCQGCGSPTPHSLVFGTCACRVWPLAAPEALLRRPGRCGFCGVAPKPPFYDTEEEALRMSGRSILRSEPDVAGRDV